MKVHLLGNNNNNSKESYSSLSPLSARDLELGKLSFIANFNNFLT